MWDNSQRASEGRGNLLVKKTWILALVLLWIPLLTACTTLQQKTEEIRNELNDMISLPEVILDETPVNVGAR